MVASNGPCIEQRGRLDNSNLSKFFSRLYISEEIGVNKPDLKFFNYIFNDLKISDKSSILMIGDDLKADIKGAMNAGIDSCWVKSKSEENILGIKPTFTIRKLDELTQYL